MREILFRGKSLDNGEWVEGNFYESGISGVFILQNKTRKTIDAKTGEITLRDEPIPFEVLPSTIGQYTGLKDKHGKRIFEGDIIKRFWLGAEILYCVRYDGENAHFIGKALNKIGFTTFDGDGEMFEVIGNIHDNPELLEK